MRSASWVIVASALAFASPLCAQAPLELTWTAPPGCPDRAAVELEVARLLGGARRETPLAVRAVMMRRGARLVLEITTFDGAHEGTRVVDGTQCESLAQAGALVIALAIDPDAVARVAAESGAEPEAEAGTESDTRAETEGETETALLASRPRFESSVPDSQTSVPSAGATADAPTPDSEPPYADSGASVSFLASADAILGVGPLPSASYGAAALLGMRVGIVEVGVGGLFLAEQGATVSGARGGSFGLAIARLRGCLALHVAAPLELAPCVELDAGAMWGRGEGVPVTRSGTAPWIGAAAGAEARIRIVEALSIVLRADLSVPFSRPEFALTIDGVVTPVHTAFAVGGVFGAGVQLRLP